MQRPTPAFLRTIEQGKRIMPLMLAVWPRDAGATPLLAAAGPLPDRIASLARWDTWSEFEAGTHNETVTKLDPDTGEAYVTLTQDGWSVWEQHDSYLYSPSQYALLLWPCWIIRLPDDRILLGYIRPVDAEFHLFVQFSTDEGATWSIAADLHALHPEWESGAAETNVAIRLGDTIALVAGCIYTTDDSGLTWRQNIPLIGDLGHSVAIWSYGDVGYAITVDESGSHELYTTLDCETWSVVGPVTGLDVGVNPTGAIHSGRRHLLCGYDDLEEVVRIYSSHDGLNWTHEHSTGPGEFVAHESGGTIARLHLTIEKRLIVTVGGFDVLLDDPTWHGGAWRWRTYAMTAELDAGDPWDGVQLAPMFTPPETCLMPSFVDTIDGRTIVAAIYTTDHDIYDLHLWTSGPGYSDGIWTSAVTDSRIDGAPWDRVLLGGIVHSGGQVLQAEFRSGATAADCAAATWYPASGYYSSGDNPRDLPDLRYVQARVSLFQDSALLPPPRLYVCGLSGAMTLTHSGVKEWQDHSVSLGEPHAQQQVGSIQLTQGPALAAYWPWEGARIHLGLYPYGGDFKDIIWLACANVCRLNVDGDILTLTLGEDAE